LTWWLVVASDESLTIIDKNTVNNFEADAYLLSKTSELKPLSTVDKWSER
jgi:hypothetical protein